MNPAKPKVQHYVPRLILKRFAEENEQVWVFDKKRSSVFKTNISKIAAEKYFYDFEYEGYDLSLESTFENLESGASEVIDHITLENSLASLSDEERILFSKFLALQLVRTRQWRNMWEQAREDLLVAIRKMGFKPEQIEGYKEQSNEDPKLAHMRSIHKSFEYTPYFLNKFWVLFTAPEKRPFWISDNPLTLQNMHDFGYFGNLGLAVKGIEIYFPISKCHTLGLLCPSHLEMFKKTYKDYISLSNASPQMAAEAVDKPLLLEQIRAAVEDRRAIPYNFENVINHNSLQVMFSTRFIFSSNNDFSLAEEMINAHPEYREGPKMEVR
ncbi:MAG: DUF4238 domain-containing protein [Candidatus Eisenbacteria bacterium]|uniref:DUF4238 domain-containing protein n=1 Tax=Eiseniibacteriota bacterium TaxID=2212470 RepID=A0A948S099_UNCEI|nr:DUF4238 domain-containing protein [Candidatus Eisenbacteria bacterium]MBU1950467.1 DUF4238 domain-containing protein [Candidatus Eisenbacteria bacterium]MBU2691459.1 DUF4238 domain-containing protein [Candidatus Eisenbacteria bacterium]